MIDLKININEDQKIFMKRIERLQDEFLKENGDIPTKVSVNKKGYLKISSILRSFCVYKTEMYDGMNVVFGENELEVL